MGWVVEWVGWMVMRVVGDGMVRVGVVGWMVMVVCMGWMIVVGW